MVQNGLYEPTYAFFNSYYDVAHTATTKGLRTEQEYDEMIGLATNYLNETKHLITAIPNEANSDFKDDTKEFLQTICARLEGIIERQKTP